MAKMTLSKQLILDTAAAIFMQQGYHATSMDDIAREMGSTKGRLYHHYTSKIDLFFAVHREGMRLLFEAVVPASTMTGSGIDVLQAMLKAHAMAVLEHHTYESVVAQGVQMHRFGATTPSERRTLDTLIKCRDDFEALFKKQLTAAKLDKTLGDVDVSIAVKTMLGGIQWSLIWYRPEKDETPESRAILADQMTRTLVDGLKAR
ncbi:MAG: TetR family transcriptional regulator [Advenella sp.]|uniref:TetR/AcrR family transcriptional regulator n=1 Tax=Advenella kashmirensis TaxID=310575 RepID=A0A356LIF8_9BURK|nr:TetR/AcrR family transcriptional regulator [Advenella sp. FME57]HBP30704.1 TetR/AcrR family transcriptional regulator [Advenella kashmirensis]